MSDSQHDGLKETNSPPRNDSDPPATSFGIDASTEPKSPENITRAAARGTLFTLILRLISFLCTQITIRALDPKTLGTNIQLELLLTTLLFISREGFRLALTQNVIPENWSVAWLTVPVVTFFSGSTLIWQLFFTTTGDKEQSGYRMAVILYCFSSWVEGCGEPAVLFFLRKLEVPPRVEAEGIASVVKTLATATGIQLQPSIYPPIIFGLAQLAYASTYTVYLYGRAWSRPDWKASSLPYLTLSKFWNQLHGKTCYTTLVYTLQGFFKHMLTEADKIVLTAMADSYDQGVYAMGASYGGMAARIVLQPLEENARLLWSRLASNSDSSDEGQRELLRSYVTLVKLVLYIGLVFSCFAVHYTNLLLNILAGRTWGSNMEASNVLAAFCVYTAFLALNGMTEAFVYAVGGGDLAAAEMTKLGFIHTMTGLAFAISAFVFVGSHGTLGLVAANCVGMFIRSIYSVYFATNYFSTINNDGRLSLLFQISPHPVILMTFASAWLATRLSLQTLMAEGFHLQVDVGNLNWLIQTGQHIAVGVVFLLGIIALVMSLEQTLIESIKDMARERKGHGKLKDRNKARPKQD